MVIVYHTQSRFSSKANHWGRSHDVLKVDNFNFPSSEDTELFSPQCGVPRSAYFWTDNLHPTSNVQNLIAQQVAIELEKLPQQHPN